MKVILIKDYDKIYVPLGTVVYNVVITKNKTSKRKYYNGTITSYQGTHSVSIPVEYCEVLVD